MKRFTPGLILDQKHCDFLSKICLQFQDIIVIPAILLISAFATAFSKQLKKTVATHTLHTFEHKLEH